MVLSILGFFVYAFECTDIFFLHQINWRAVVHLSPCIMQADEMSWYCNIAINIV